MPPVATGAPTGGTLISGCPIGPTGGIPLGPTGGGPLGSSPLGPTGGGPLGGSPLGPTGGGLIGGSLTGPIGISLTGIITPGPIGALGHGGPITCGAPAAPGGGGGGRWKLENMPVGPYLPNGPYADDCMCCGAEKEHFILRTLLLFLPLA